MELLYWTWLLEDPYQYEKFSASGEIHDNDSKNMVQSRTITLIHQDKEIVLMKVDKEVCQLLN